MQISSALLTLNSIRRKCFGMAVHLIPHFNIGKKCGWKPFGIAMKRHILKTQHALRTQVFSSQPKCAVTL